MMNQAHVSYPFLLAILVGTFFSYNFSDFELFMIMLSSWLPDFDYIYALHVMKKKPGKYRTHHDFITHAPLLYIPVVLIVMYFNWQIGLILLYGLITHFVMDSLIASEGIMWAYPFSKKFYVWTKYTNGAYNVYKWLDAYKKLPIYWIDNIAFVITFILAIYLIIV